MALGDQAGMIDQSSNTLAIGFQAGLENQVTNSIVLNAGGIPLNAGMTGLFIQPIRFTEELPIEFGLQGLRGWQSGSQGFQGYQGYQGFQGHQGLIGAVGTPGGSNGNIQYNILGEFRGTSDLTYTSSSNTFSFGEGRTGGAVKIIGGLVQGAEPGTVRGPDTIKLVNTVNGKRFMEFGADTPNTSYVDFHSNDSRPNDATINWDGFILSSGGDLTTSQGGNLVFDNALSPAYIFTGLTSPMNLNGNIIYGAVTDSTDRPVTPIQEIVTSGTAASPFASQRLFTSSVGGTFNVMACTPNGGFALVKFWAYKNGGGGFSFAQIAANNSTADISISVTNDDNLVSVYFTNNISPNGTVMSYTIIQSIRNSNY